VVPGTCDQVVAQGSSRLLAGKLIGLPTWAAACSAHGPVVPDEDEVGDSIHLGPPPVGDGHQGAVRFFSIRSPQVLHLVDICRISLTYALPDLRLYP
jgi:hypothetical protein